MKCDYCKNSPAAYRVTFAMAKLHEEIWIGGVLEKHFEGPTLNMNVCKFCYDSFYDQDPYVLKVHRISCYAGEVGSVVALIMAELFRQLISSPAMAAWKWVFSDSKIILIIVRFFLGATGITFLLTFFALLGYFGFFLIVRALTLPWWFKSRVLRNKEEIVKKHPLYRRLYREGYHKIFWSSPDGQIVAQENDLLRGKL